MDTNARERGDRTGEEYHGLFAHGVRRQDVCDLPDDDALIVCPECGALAEAFDLIEHREWCLHGERRPICQGNL